MSKLNFENFFSFALPSGSLKIPEKRLGVAVSGGADSVALLRALHEIRHKLAVDIFVLHVDHAVRPESAEDANWVKELAEKFSLPFCFRRLSPQASSQSSALNSGQCRFSEAWAREERLKAFADMATQLRLDLVCTAHHAQDQAETFLLKIIRGTSLAGLRIIRPMRRFLINGSLLAIWRPLLQVAPMALREYLNNIGQAWLEDKTNNQKTFLRNRIRLELVPLLNDLRPQTTSHVCKVAEDICETHALISKLAKRYLSKATPTFLPLGQAPPPAVFSEVLRRWWFLGSDLKTDRFDRNFLARLFDLANTKKCGRKAQSGDRVVVRVKDGLMVIPKVNREANIRRDSSCDIRPGSSDPATALLFPGKAGFANKVLITSKEIQPSFEKGIWLNSFLVGQSLVVRYPLPGDYFYFNKMNCRKKLSRWLIDKKIPSHKRAQLLVIAGGNEIFWVPELSLISSRIEEPGAKLWYLGIKEENY